MYNQLYKEVIIKMGLDYDKIGNRIRVTRRGKHISQEKMAEALYSNQNQISLLESAKSGAISDLRELESVCLVNI